MFYVKNGELTFKSTAGIETQLSRDENQVEEIKEEENMKEYDEMYLRSDEYYDLVGFTQNEGDYILMKNRCGEDSVLVKVISHNKNKEEALKNLQKDMNHR